MAVLTPGKKGKRRPSYRGRLVFRTLKGQQIAQAWPKGRVKVKTGAQFERQEWFRQANAVARYTDGRQQALSRCAMNHLPVRPYDALISAMAGRLWSVETDDGRTLNSMAARGDVSKNLDVLSQEPGRILIRGPDFWEAFPRGAIDQYIASQGPDVPPIWKDLPAPGGGGAGMLGFSAASTVGTNSTRFYDFSDLEGIENNVQILAPKAFTFKNLAVHINVTPQAGDTLTVTLRLNGADTILTVTLGEGETTKLDTANEVAIVQGDLFNMKVVTVSMPASSRVMMMMETV